MSGIVGIVNADGAPIDRDLLRAMTSSLVFRGPDAERVWSDGSVGFGHTLFATTDEARTERQPCTIDGNLWIVADARVDGRADLIRDLSALGRTGMSGANDAELLLHAWDQWGEASLDRLVGDFAFAIWDRRARRLFCARDQFGARPLYYAYVGGHLIFSNTLECVRRHPAVSANLNDLAIADYLLFYYNQEAGSTVYADIARLPPAHVLVWDGAAPRVRRYWRLTQKAEIRYRRSQEYVEQFRSLLTTAVSDRLRTRKAGVLMSGGLDSPSVAATAQAVLSARNAPFDLIAYTDVCGRVVPNPERHYAGLVAAALNIPIQYYRVDYPLYYRSSEPELSTPEPMDEPFMAQYLDLYRLIAANSRVVLTGSDLDTVLAERPMVHVLGLLERGSIATLAADLWRSARVQRRLPRIGIRSSATRWRASRHRAEPSLPSWLNQAFVERLHLRQRLHECAQPRTTHPLLPMRPRVSRALSSTFWMQLFEGRDAGVTGVPLEFRHPFADVRLIDYLLAIPLIPWCDGKTIVRVAMRGVLPDAVLARAKTPIVGADPVIDRLRDPQSAWLDAFESTPDFGKYVDRARIPLVTGEHASGDALQHLRLHSLNQWLANRNPSKGESNVEAEDTAIA